MRAAFAIALVAALAACGGSEEPDGVQVEVLPSETGTDRAQVEPDPGGGDPDVQETEPEVTQQQGSIGVATMREDGTIVLQLRAEGPGVVGDGTLEYPQSHEQYRYVLDHLGGLRPGEQKPVPPFPDE